MCAVLEVSVVALPGFEQPFCLFTTSLEGTDYLFRYRYNQREQCWYFSLMLPDGTPLIKGVKIVCNVDLIAHLIDKRRPPGALIAISTSTETTPPTLTEFGPGKRVTLMYLSKDELPAS